MLSIQPTAPTLGYPPYPAHLASRLLLLLVVSLVAARVCLSAFGPPGLVAYVALWLILLPLLLRELRGVLAREWPGALFVLLTAASADYLDAALTVEQRVSLVIVLLSAGYLAMRWRASVQVLRSPVVVVFALFMAQQIWSAHAFAVDDLSHIVLNRVSVVLSLLAGMVLMRRPGGERALPMLIILGALLSVPLMIHETLDESLVLFPALVGGPIGDRAAGLFANPNAAGAAIGFAVAFALGEHARGALGRAATAVVLIACATGLLACASRGALIIVLLLLAANWWLGVVGAGGRRPVVRVLLVGATLVAVAPWVRSSASGLEAPLRRLGFDNVERLGEVVRAMTGSPDELLDDDSHRLSLLEESLPLIAARPWLGYGTANFGVIKDRGVHNQFLAVLGENGVVGGALYALFLVALLRVAARAPHEHRRACLLVMVAWLLHHLDCHNLLDYRNAILPIAYVCGLDGVNSGRAPG